MINFLTRYIKSLYFKKQFYKMAIDKNMFAPPESVRGMKSLDMRAFKKAVKIPVLEVKGEFPHFVKVLETVLIKMPKFTSFVDTASGRLYYIDPLKLPKESMSVEKLLEYVLGVTKSKNLIKLMCTSPVPPENCNLYSTELQITFDNYSYSSVLKSVLPEGSRTVSGWTHMGHILHLNLTDDLVRYKNVIGEVLLNKIPNVQMVINKTDSVDNFDNSYRSLAMEVIAGEGSTITSVRENGCTFEFNFAKVYWNSRLCQEHETMVAKIGKDDALYDVMAGVGPFCIPVAKSSGTKHILANDLNPSSYHWLNRNAVLNKVQTRFKSHNMDGFEFVKTVVRNHMLDLWCTSVFDGNIHILMNLPATAETFLRSFVGLYADLPPDNNIENFVAPIVHVYMFTKDQKQSSIRNRVAFYLNLVDELPNYDAEVTAMIQEVHENNRRNPSGSKVPPPKYGRKLGNKFKNDAVEIPGLNIEEIHFVRRVAPAKAMVRVKKYKLNIYHV